MTSRDKNSTPARYAIFPLFFFYFNGTIFKEQGTLNFVSTYSSSKILGSQGKGEVTILDKVYSKDRAFLAMSVDEL